MNKYVVAYTEFGSLYMTEYTGYYGRNCELDHTPSGDALPEFFM